MYLLPESAQNSDICCCSRILKKYFRLGTVNVFTNNTTPIRQDPELVQWFQDRCGETYGGVDCRSILEGHPENQALRCPKLMEATYREARELLEEFGFDIDGMAEEAFPD